MCRIEDADGWLPLTDVGRSARKEHRCYECDRTITVGERYRYITGISEVGFDVIKQCAHCDAAAEWLIVACSGYLFGGIAEELREHRDEEPDLRSAMLDALIQGIEHDWWGGRAAVPDRRLIAESIPREAWSGVARQIERMRVEAAGQMALTDG